MVVVVVVVGLLAAGTVIVVLGALAGLGVGDWLPRGGGPSPGGVEISTGRGSYPAAAAAAAQGTSGPAV